jgi:diguanylate cyclase (GGDEF)-like protein
MNESPRKDTDRIRWPAVPGFLVVAGELLERQGRTTIWTLCAGLMVLAFATDVASGPELAWSIFYALPVAVAAWELGWKPALLLVVSAALAWLAADVMSGAHYDLPVAQYWNTLVRAAFFLVVAYVLVLLRFALQHERELARTDWLTSLPNTRSFLESTAHEIARARRTGSPFTLAYLDLDGFKAVNDTLGHAAGDDLLRQVGAELRRCVRDVDIVARLGGDEFAILLPDTCGADAEVALARVHAAVGVLAERAGWPVHFSAGAVTSTDPAGAEDIIRAADAAMYEAKRRGGDSTVYHELTPA